MTWAIVITGIDCDEHTIVSLRTQLLSAATIQNTGTLTLQQWLFDEYWRTPEQQLPRVNGDTRLISTVLG